ncbi:MAG TPA: DUF2298 domain-containing protein [Burkholderiaceae bacterium]|jgi:uncharacterized membrane protein|nr:DUF2298 domain-containing protein [Burkholderiaceae bacterium]
MSGGIALAWSDGSFVYALRWWATLLLLSAGGWLLAERGLRHWHDRGWAISRPLFLLALAYPIWALANFFPVFTPAFQWSGAGCLLLAGLLLRFKTGVPAREAFPLRTLAFAELRFLLPFAFYLAMRGFSHDLIGLEKFMDFAFVNSAERSATLPPPDPWFAGAPINYYYFGHYLAAFLCKLTGVPPAFGYNLMLATLFGSVFQLSYALVMELTAGVPQTLRNAMSAITATWLTLGGNIHGFLYGFIKPWLVDAGWLARPAQAFLLSDPTRFVGHDPPTQDKLIHEFPAYAFYVGDLHAHLSNLPQVLLLLAALLEWGRRSAQGAQKARFVWLAIAAALVGIFAMANSWDALMYAGLLGVLLVLRGLAAVRHGARALGVAVSEGLLAGIVVAATALPFFLHFEPLSDGFHLTHSHTPAWQWMILYGEQAMLGLLGCALAFSDRVRRLQPESRFLAMLVGFGIAFALVPELVYLKDIYGAEFYRGNTAFKFGFQAFTLLTVAAGAALAMIAALPLWRGRTVALVLALELALVPPLYYGWFVLQGGLGVWREREWTLDGLRYVTLSYPEDAAAIAWLRQQPRDVVVEAVGDSYTYAARIATNAGGPDVLGWPVHEQLWRGSSPQVWERRDDVAHFYTGRDADAARRFLARYHARWIVVGGFERERYRELDVAFLESLGRVVFRSGNTFIVEVRPVQ